MTIQSYVAIVVATLVCVASENALAQANDDLPTPSPSQTPSTSDVRRANRTLGTRVQRALSKNGVETANVNVLARGGNVTLSDSVGDESQIGVASRVAQSVQGVTSVSNRLTIRAGGQ
nr:BON domain-containing protein [Caballeronia sp. GAFFF1]